MKCLRLLMITLLLTNFSVSIFADSLLKKVEALKSVHAIKQMESSLYTFAISPNNKEIYAIVYSNVVSLNIIDIKSGSTRNVVPLPGSALISSLVCSADGKKVYITDFINNIYVFDTMNQQVIGRVTNKPETPFLLIAHNIAISPNGDYLYSTDGVVEDPSQKNGPFLHIIDTHKDTVLNKIKKQQMKPDEPIGWLNSSFAFGHDSSFLYISDMLRGTIDRLNTQTNELKEGVISYSEYVPIIDIALSPNEDKLYVLSWIGGLYITDTKNYQLIDKIADVGKEPVALALNALGTKLYVASKQSDSVAVIETAKPYKLLKNVSVGKEPKTLRVSDGELYVGNVGSGTISVIDMVTDMVIKTISISTHSKSEVLFQTRIKSIK